MSLEASEAIWIACINGFFSILILYIGFTLNRAVRLHRNEQNFIKAQISTGNGDTLGQTIDLIKKNQEITSDLVQSSLKNHEYRMDLHENNDNERFAMASEERERLAQQIHTSLEQINQKLDSTAEDVIE